MRTRFKTARSLVPVGLASVLTLGSLGAQVASPSAPAPASHSTADRRLAILCYHEISSDPAAKLEVVPPADLRARIRACKRAGWTFLRLSDVVSRLDRPWTLPRRAMVLTFDDGYQSFADSALPVLEAENVPATIAIVTSWIDRPPPDLPPIMSWKQLAAVLATGRVEIVSHTHDLHRYETCNPWKDTWPAVATRRWIPDQKRYENRDEYRRRIADDLAQTQAVGESRLGARFRVLVWPYGEHNDVARSLAKEAGFEATLALGGRMVTPGDLEMGCLPRFLMTRDTPPGLAWLDPPPRVVRAAQVDLDALYDPNPSVFVRKIDALVRRTRTIGATHVFLQACPDPEGNGRLRDTWFMNHQAPVRADVWSMVARKLQNASLRVWIRAPVMNLGWVWDQRPELRIPFDAPSDKDAKTPWYFRLSPDLPDAHTAAVDFFTDLAVYLPIDGVLFDDDAYMLPGERLSGNGDSSAVAKAKAIDGLLDDVRSAVRAWRPEARFARNLYAPVVEQSGVHPEFSQDFERCVRSGDLAVVMAYARMEGHQADAARWTTALTWRALRRWKSSGARASAAPVMIKLQAYDWDHEQWIPRAELSSIAAAARDAGAVQLGVYPVMPEDGDLPDDLLAPRRDSVAGTSR
jgi:biofilm PGA synthesis lipoprotein PgaB